MRHGPYDRQTAARKLELPLDRLGDLVVLAGRDVVLGRTPALHDLSVLEGGLRSHGGRYEAGLPGSMLSVLLGPTAQVAEPLVRDPRVEVVCFTGSVAVGKRLPTIAGYKRLVLELGGNDPLLVLRDADLDLAARLAAEGSYRNSGQRCTAVKRILVHSSILDAFLLRLLDRTYSYPLGDQRDENTLVGTVIDEHAAAHLMTVVHEAVAAGAKVLCDFMQENANFDGKFSLLEGRVQTRSSRFSAPLAPARRAPMAEPSRSTRLVASEIHSLIWGFLSSRLWAPWMAASRVS